VYELLAPKKSVLRIRSGAFFLSLDTGSVVGKGMNIPDQISESLETIFWVKIIEFFDADQDPGWKKFGSGMFIPDPQHCKKYFFFLTNVLDLDIKAKYLGSHKVDAVRGTHLWRSR
jgi:hypothetical protein